MIVQHPVARTTLRDLGCGARVFPPKPSQMLGERHTARQAESWPVPNQVSAVSWKVAL
jgi:hypothetical protein